jgi:peptidoglycan/LPS O-acetylase OafA/YrhL
MNVARPPVCHPTPQQWPAMIAGVELVRAAAALAVVTLHAGVPYLQHPMPGLIWPVRDSPSLVVDALFWGIEVVIMPVFLAVAGFLLCRSAQRLSPWQLVLSRARRLLVPLLFGVFVVLPIDLYIWTLGLVAEGVVPLVKLKSLKFASPVADQIWGLSHLWFLLYVFLYVVCMAGVLHIGGAKRVRARCPTARRPQGLRIGTGRAATPWGIAAVVSLALLAAVATLTLRPEVVWGFQHAFLPVPSKWVYSGLFFLAGFGLASIDPNLAGCARRAPRLLALGGVMLLGAVRLGTWSLLEAERMPEDGLLSRATLALLTVLAAGTLTAGILGAAAGSLRTAPRWIRYLAAASFWIYLVHHPLLGLIHIDLKWCWPAGAPELKMAISLVAATALSLSMYEIGVRRSVLGRWLGMALEPREAATAANSAQPPNDRSLLAWPDRAEPERRAA